jgi:Flp pilus assembly protein TadD
MTARTAADRDKDRTTRHSGRTQSRESFPSHSRNQSFLIAVGLIAITVALYYPVGSHGFLNYDDEVYVFNNLHVKAGLHWATVRWAFSSFYASNWHPLTWLSHALDCQLFGVNPGPQHLVNLLLHVINVLLLCYVLQQATGWVGRSAMVSALFALHPLNVESVAWIAERKNVLSMMFFLLALEAYRRYARNPAVRRYLAVAGLFALGLMAKPQVITLPFVLLLWDYWPLERMIPPNDSVPHKTFGQLVVEKIPLFALCVASALVTVFAQYETGAMSGSRWQSVPVRLENAIVAYVRYLGKAFWPSNLAILYPHPGDSIRAWQVIASLLLLAAITAIAFALRKRHRYLLVGWLWFLGTLVPMIGIVQVGVQSIADRYSHLPFIGLFIMACWTVADWFDERHLSRVWLRCVSFAVMLALGVTARRQLDRWADNNLLWWQVVALETQALQDNPQNWVAQDVVAHGLLKLGEVEAAIPHFREAAALHPADPDSNVNLGVYEQQHNNFTAAIEQYKKVLAMTEDAPRQNAQERAQAFSNMGYAYRELKDYSQAQASFQQAVKLNPDDGRSWLGIGLMEQKAGNVDAAIEAYTRSLQITPFDWGYLLLAKALEDSGRQAESDFAWRKAAKISPSLQRAQKTADAALAK